MSLKIKKGMNGSRCGRGRRETTATLKLESKKARRAEGKKALNEWEGIEPTIVAPSGPTTFRLVITTQVYENYGAHNWDGEGECPQYWKAKGGSEYRHDLGDANAVIDLGHAGLCDLVRSLSSKTTRCDDYYDEWVINWRLVPSNEETDEERDLREMLEWDMIDKETRHRRLVAGQVGHS